MNRIETLPLPDSARASWGKDLLLLAVLIGLLFGFGLGARPLSNPDEGRYAEIIREMAIGGDYVTPRLNGVKYFEKPALFYWLGSGAIQLFGLHEWSLRLWPALFALLGCLIVYGAGRRLFDRVTGLMAAAILATSLLYYAMSRVIDLDMAVSVWLSGALLAFLLGVREPAGRTRRLYLWGCYGGAALATMTKGLIGIAIPGMVIVGWLLILQNWRMLKPLYLPSGTALFLLIAAPWHLLVAQANPEFLNFYFIHEHLLRYTTEIHHHNKPVWFFIPVLLGGFLPWTAFVIQAVRHHLAFSWRLRHHHQETIFLMVWIGLVFLFFSVSQSKLITYILPVFPPLALLVGHYLASSGERREPVGVQIGDAAFVIIAALMIGGLLLLPRFHAPIDPRAFANEQYDAITVILAGMLVTWIVRRARGFRWAFVVLSISTACVLAVMNGGFALFDTRSVKTLAGTLKPHLRPGDEVVSYRTYYQDLPVYLERRITVVEWTGELAFGATIEDTSDWMIDDATFWQRWQSDATLYMVTSRGQYERLLAEQRGPFHLMAHTDASVLVSNRETGP